MFSVSTRPFGWDKIAACALSPNIPSDKGRCKKQDDKQNDEPNLKKIVFRFIFGGGETVRFHPALCHRQKEIHDPIEDGGDSDQERPERTVDRDLSLKDGETQERKQRADVM